MFENFTKNNNASFEAEGNPVLEEEKLQLREHFFHEIIASKIVDTYESEMAAIGFNTEQINEFREKILSISVSDREALYAFPWELKQRALPAFLKKVNDGVESIDSMTTKIIDASKQKHRKIAYHASKENIIPKKEQSHGQLVESWVVYGKEKDHRDNDLPMAYYSFDYENLYRVKNPNYIYIVSIQQSESSGHRKDGNNEWGRAPSLTVIEKIDLKEVDGMVKQLVNDEIKKTPMNSEDSLAA
jgi:hypothetical protein